MIHSQTQRKLVSLAECVVLCVVTACRAQETPHLSVAGRDVAMWKPAGRVPTGGYPLIVFSHGFTGCNTQTAFLMEALAQAGYLVLAPSHKDSPCGKARGSGIPQPQAPLLDAAKWDEQTYRDRRDDMEAVLDAALAGKEFYGVPVDPTRVGVVGHSLGGYTVLGLAGGWASWKDARVKAVLALSPHCSPFLARGQLSKMNVPVMYQGGTRDAGETSLVKKPRGAYDESSEPKEYVELDGAGHFAWTNFSRAYRVTIDAYSVAFFDAALRGDKAALTRLLHEGRPKDVSEVRSAP